MKRGLIPNEVRRRERVNVFTPSVLAEWQEAENERDFISWCRKEEVRETRPDDIESERKNWLHLFTSVLP